MKYIMIAALLFCMPVYADESCTVSTTGETTEEQLEISTDVPNHLKGAKIVVVTADGRHSTVPAERFKVVPRKQQYLVTKTLQQDKLTCRTDALKNRVSLLGGKGSKEGLTTAKEPGKVVVESRVGAVGGVQYQRLVTDRISLGAQLQTNESALVNIGLDF